MHTGRHPIVEVLQAPLMQSKSENHVNTYLVVVKTQRSTLFKKNPDHTKPLTKYSQDDSKIFLSKCYDCIRRDMTRRCLVSSLMQSCSHGKTCQNHACSKSQNSRASSLSLSFWRCSFSLAVCVG